MTDDDLIRQAVREAYSDAATRPKGKHPFPVGRSGVALLPQRIDMLLKPRLTFGLGLLQGSVLANAGRESSRVQPRRLDPESGDASKPLAVWFFTPEIATVVVEPLHRSKLEHWHVSPPNHPS